MIAVVDYQKGNIQSVVRGLAAAGAEVQATQDATCIERADAIVLPGVGAFTDAMQTMSELGQTQAICKAVDRGTPFLGICLGLHLMFERGEEHAPDNTLTPGLGFISGTVRRLPRTDSEGTLYKIPHVGWNRVCFLEEEAGSVCETSSAQVGMFSEHSDRVRTSERLNISRFSLEDDDNPLLEGIPDGAYFYFTHSYIAPESSATVATTTHSVTFPSVVQIGNAFGVQFHPEKSSDAGERLLANFVRLVRKA